MSEQVSLKSLCVEKIDMLFSTADGYIDYFDISSVDNENKKIISYQTLQAKDAPSRTRQLVKTNDILVSTVRPNLNAVAMVNRDTGNTMVASTGFCILRANDKADSHYLFHFVQSSIFVDAMISQATGASYPAVSNSIVKNCSVPLPDLPTQRLIAATLDKVSEGIDVCRKMLVDLDELVKSRFVEMFGDMLLNTMKLQEQELYMVADIVSGITKGRKITSDDLKEVPYMAVSNVKEGYIDWTTVKTIKATQDEIDQYRLMPNDVLMTEGGDPDKLGRGAIIKEPPQNCIHQNHIFRVRLSNAVLPEYFAEYLQHQKAKQYFLGCAKQTTGIASINMRQLRALPVLVPPLDQQQLFAQYVVKVQEIKTKEQNCLKRLEVLEKALMQKYFD